MAFFQCALSISTKLSDPSCFGFMIASARELTVGSLLDEVCPPYRCGSRCYKRPQMVNASEEERWQSRTMIHMRHNDEGPGYPQFRFFFFQS